MEKLTLEKLGAAAEGRRQEMADLKDLPKDLADGLKETDVLRLWVAEAYGGLQKPLTFLLEAVQTLAYHEASLAWVAMVTGTGSLISGYLQPETAKAIFGRRDAMVGGWVLPAGRGLKVDGGIKVSGKWAWGSGTKHCTTVTGGVAVFDESKGALDQQKPEIGIAFFQPSDVRWLNNWNVNGLMGTGSGEYVVKELFVPNDRWIQFPVKEPQIQETLFRMPFNGSLAAGVSSVGLGLAKRALDEIKKMAKEKKPAMARRTLSEKPVVQYHLAQKEAQYHSAKTFLDHIAKEVWQEAEKGELSIDARNQLRLAATHAASVAAEVVEWSYKTGGGSSIWDGTKLQEIQRDMNVVTQHGLVAASNFEMIGKVSLGFPFNKWVL